MLFWIFVIFLIVGIIMWILASKHWHTDWSDWVGPIGILLVIFAGLATIISGIVIVDEHSCKEVNYETYMTIYETLTYQYENDFYNNDNDYGKKELMNDIIDYNKVVIRKRELSKTNWLGIYYSDIYNDLPLIDISKGT